MEPTPSQPPQPPTQPPIPAQPSARPPQQSPAWHQLNYNLPPVRATRPVQPLTVNGKALTSGWIVGLTLVVLMVLCGCFGSGYAMGLTATDATPTTGTNVGIANQPTQQVQPTAPVTPLPTTPKPTATPSSVVLTVAGNGDKTTRSFTVRGTWELAWTCGSNSTVFGASIYDVRTNDYAPSVDGPSYDCPANGGSDSTILHVGGTYYLSIICGGDWTLTVTDLPN